MKTTHLSFDEHEVLHEIKHFLPAQAPLKDFVHHNTLHAFQNMKFYDAIQKASKIFGYKVSLSLEEYRKMYESGKISPAILDRIIIERKGESALSEWKAKAVYGKYNSSILPRIGLLRENWRKQFHIDLDLDVHPILFRILCSYLDQGISIWSFPIENKGFLSSMREMERTTFTSFFKCKRAKKLVLKPDLKIAELLKILVGDETLFKQYLYDQQFAHQGWSGIVSAVEDNPVTLLEHRKITLQELIIFELLLEIDALDRRFGETWAPLSINLKNRPSNIFAEIKKTEQHEIMMIWQDAFEWTFYDQVLAGVESIGQVKNSEAEKSFQALFCIDDRECSIRRYVEKTDVKSETYGTAGFFGVEFYYQPEHGKTYTKVCPAPVFPKHLIKEVGSTAKQKSNVHFGKHTHTPITGYAMAQTVGFFSGLRLAMNIFKPTMSSTTASSFRHMDRFSSLTIENKNSDDLENGLQIGFTIPEMALRAENLLRSIGLVANFAPIVYIVGHGATSVNNTHYAGYDCGACSGRPGSVNARVLAFMANHPQVRKILANNGIHIPESTQFFGALHDTTRDDITFYDENLMNPANAEAHEKNKMTFEIALDLNAKERSRRFESIDTTLSAKKIHEKIKTRSVSLFEPRPELNHATTTLCFVGRRNLSKDLYLDRRAFLNSYDYKVDADGKYLVGILAAVAGVCGGINLEYFFSRVDNQKLGAGTKLAHNVMGLFGVANGIDGDLRPGLPSQMVEVHDPIRLMGIVEHFPEVVLEAVKKNPATFEWFENEWVRLAVINPETQEIFVMKNGAFEKYKPLTKVATIADISPIIEKTLGNIDVHLIKQD